ncbi:hypothetical protein AC578_9472 [Pseudocercospora eumusae]|uniref:Uncharacterized protein n=1 Tax=Pseudocercospora eumusae TaxID=321146 RepID=A0A139GUC7_9PEZI|nr:hypothetical protein AC578_9472 [Pseudocercospora eumusae]
MSSHNFKPTTRSRRNDDTPGPKVVFVSAHPLQVDRERAYSCPEDEVEQTDCDSDPFKFSAHLGTKGAIGDTTADHDSLRSHTIAQGARNSSHPTPTASSLDPESEIKAPKHDRKNLGLPIVQSKYNMPKPKDARRRAADPATASQRESQRRWRWRNFSHAIDKFANETKSFRWWYQHSQVCKGAWALEHARLDKRIPGLEAELAKMKHQEKANMNAAAKKLEDEHGEEIENGRISQEKLRMWAGFLKMENDCYPDELVECTEDDMKEEFEAFLEDAAREGNEGLWECIEDAEAE